MQVIKYYPHLKILPKNDTLFETVLISINDFFVSDFLKRKINYKKLVNLINYHSHNKIFHKSYKRILVIKPAFGLEKEKIFKNSSAFILPSFSEGLPMAPLEAMSYGVPCLISENCNLNQAIKLGAALKTNPSVDEIVKSLKKIGLIRLISVFE